MLHHACRQTLRADHVSPPVAGLVICFLSRIDVDCFDESPFNPCHPFKRNTIFNNRRCRERLNHG